MAKKKRQRNYHQPRDENSSFIEESQPSVKNENAPTTAKTISGISNAPIITASEAQSTQKKEMQKKQVQSYANETMRQNVASSNEEAAVSQSQRQSRTSRQSVARKTEKVSEFQSKSSEFMESRNLGERDFYGRTDPSKKKEARKRRQQRRGPSEFEQTREFTENEKQSDSKQDSKTDKERQKRKKKVVNDQAKKDGFGSKQTEYTVEKVFDEKIGTSKYVVMAAGSKKPTKKKRKNKRKYYEAAKKEKEQFSRQTEQDDEDYNAGSEAAYGTEYQAEQIIGAVRDYRKDAPYRAHQRLERQAKALNRKERRLEQRQIRRGAAEKYNEFLKQNPELNEKSVRHTMQKQAKKRRIKKEYAKALRSQKTAKAAKEATQATQRATTKLAKKAQELIAKHASLLGSVAAVLMIVILIMSMFSSCGAMFSQGISGITTSTYTSLPAEIDATDLIMTDLEMQLQEEINNIETDYPDYDEYRYNLGEIGHDPFTLISYLSAVHESFTAAGMQSEVEGLFDEMYELTMTPTTETRTRTETRTGTRTVDNGDGTTSEEEYEYEVEVEYEVSILDVTLSVTSLEDIVAGKMSADQSELYQNYRISNGMLQQFYSPLDLYWYNYISSYYGYRVDPFTGATQFHRGVDIAVPENTPVYAGQDGTVVTAEYHEEYGNYVVIQDDKGYVSKYAHLSTLNVSAGQTIKHGRQIGKTGNTGRSTGSHLHIECMYNGEYYNPLFYFLTEEDTLYGERPGTSFAGDVEPPASYDDPTANLLLTEAARYLGYPYVWGGSSPSTSFDCSGFVCYVFTNSGVHNLPRTTAQGIYNQCTPVPASDAQPGDIIFFTGTYASSGPVSHVGIYCGDGVMIHCGDPIKYASINSSYWQSHFYSFGRLSE